MMFGETGRMKGYESAANNSTLLLTRLRDGDRDWLGSSGAPHSTTGICSPSRSRLVTDLKPSLELPGCPGLLQKLNHSSHKPP